MNYFGFRAISVQTARGGRRRFAYVYAYIRDSPCAPRRPGYASYVRFHTPRGATHSFFARHHCFHFARRQKNRCQKLVKKKMTCRATTKTPKFHSRYFRVRTGSPERFAYSRPSTLLREFIFFSVISLPSFSPISPRHVRRRL